ncbi:MAG: hypothetical protein E4G99_13745, partial [Anaerolineales bacterium]
MKIMQNHSSIQFSIEAIIRAWKTIVLSMVIGGILGLFVSIVRPPQYMAKAVLDIGIDFNRTHPLSRDAQAHALERVRSLLLSDEVLDATVKATQQRDPSIAIDGIWDLRARLKIGEIGSQWVLSAIDENPEPAELIASAWSEASLEALDGALMHALRAADLQNEYFGLGCELISSPETGSALWQCQASAQAPTLLEAGLRQEADLSHGLLPAMSFSLISDARSNVSLITPDRGKWILIGGFAGFVLCLM